MPWQFGIRSMIIHECAHPTSKASICQVIELEPEILTTFALVFTKDSLSGGNSFQPNH